MDDISFQNEKWTIKKLLFTKAIPNYKLPIPTEGHTIYACKDCGDRFIIESSYEYHIKRKSLQITYFCRHCHAAKLFFNRCDLLSHIRSHVVKTATINITDLKIEPLPLSYYDQEGQTNCTTEASLPLVSAIPLRYDNNSEALNEIKTFICFDCKINIYDSGIISRDRSKHYTQFRNVVYSCSVCLVSLTTKCALEAHLRIHKREPPYYCSDCGMSLTNNSILYPYVHHCESFKMMRATATLKCTVNNCNRVFRPNDILKHLRISHLKVVYKCLICSVACYKLENMSNHLKSCHSNAKCNDTKKFRYTEFMQCDMCPGRLIIPGQIQRHLKTHGATCFENVYTCWTCGFIFQLAKNLLDHQKSKHPEMFKEKIIPQTITQEMTAVNQPNRKKIALPQFVKGNGNKRKVSRVNKKRKTRIISRTKIKCCLCEATIIQNWDIIKKHFAIYHKEHVCLDAKIMLKKISMNRYKRPIKCLRTYKNNSRKPKSNVKADNSENQTVTLDNNTFICSKCGQGYENKQSLEKHIVQHRDPFMAYQCVECGESFIAKPSFSTHLLLKHGINDVNNYIDQKKCYTEESLHLQTPVNNELNEPVKENQCNICREQFHNSTDFQKHFRVHGMAFLMKNNSKSISPEKN